LEKKRREGKSETTVSKAVWLFDLATPALGPRPIAEITAPEVLAVLRQVESAGRLETARRLRAIIGQAFRFAVATGRAMSDPTSALRGALTAPVVQHRAAIIDPAPFGALLRAIDGYDGTLVVRSALQLLALTFTRPGELRLARWKEFDLDAGVWTIPANRMKMRRPHRIPWRRKPSPSWMSFAHSRGNSNCCFQACAHPRGRYRKTRSTRLYDGLDTPRTTCPAMASGRRHLRFSTNAASGMPTPSRCSPCRGQRGAKGLRRPV
jgi:hypothetical protein